MAEQDPKKLGQIYFWVGVSDVVIGAGLALASLTGLFGPGMDVLAIIGGVMALVGVGFIVFGRNQLSNADSRRGDLN